MLIQAPQQMPERKEPVTPMPIERFMLKGEETRVETKGNFSVNLYF